MNLNGLSDDKVALFIKNWKWSFSIIFATLDWAYKLNLTKWFDATCWGSFLPDIFMIKCVAFSLMVLGTFGNIIVKVKLDEAKLEKCDINVIQKPGGGI